MNVTDDVLKTIGDGIALNVPAAIESGGRVGKDLAFPICEYM